MSLMLAGLLAAASLTACGGSSSGDTTAAAAKEETTAGESAAAGESKAAESDTAAAAENGEKKVLRVAMECAYAPYNWTQPDDANGAVPIADSNEFANGYDVMWPKKISEELGYDLEIVRLDWDSLIPAVTTGQVDCVIAGQSITSARLQAVDFSEPYYYATIVTLTKKDSPFAAAKSVADLKGATCTSQQSTIWYDTCLPQIPDAQIQPAAETAPAMVMQLQTGTVDFVVTDLPTANGAVAKDENLVVLNFAGTEGDFQFASEEERAENVNIGMSVAKGNTELLDAMNSVLSTMTEDDFNTIMDQAIAVQPEV